MLENPHILNRRDGFHVKTIRIPIWIHNFVPIIDLSNVMKICIHINRNFPFHPPFFTAIDRVLRERTLNLEIIINNKTLDSGLRVIQLETAVGAAMKCFNGALGINVPRSRFLPVKKTSDLLLVMSNLYNLKNGSLVMSPQRMFPTTPLVKLGENHFAKVKEFLGRFANIPDIIELDHLTVSGDVTFGRGVSLRVSVSQLQLGNTFIKCFFKYILGYRHYYC